MIYFISEEGNKSVVKVGFTNNLKERLSVLQSGNCRKLIVLGVMKGGKDEEKVVHKQFKHLNLRREWFQLDFELAKFILKESV